MTGIKETKPKTPRKNRKRGVNYAWRQRKNHKGRRENARRIVENIMTELERIIVDDLMADGVIKFYMRYVDDTLVLIKPEDIQKFLDKTHWT